MKINLTGWKAVAALAAVGGFALLRYETRSEALETQGVEAIERWLTVESARSSLPALEEAVSTGNVRDVSSMAERLLEQRFEVEAVTRHGVGEEIVARVEYRAGPSLDDPANVRYFRMSYSTATGWRVDSETTKLTYYLAAF